MKIGSRTMIAAAVLGIGCHMAVARTIPSQGEGGRDAGGDEVRSYRVAFAYVGEGSTIDPSSSIARVVRPGANEVVDESLDAMVAELRASGEYGGGGKVAFDEVQAGPGRPGLVKDLRTVVYRDPDAVSGDRSPTMRYGTTTVGYVMVVAPEEDGRVEVSFSGSTLQGVDPKGDAGNTIIGRPRLEETSASGGYALGRGRTAVIDLGRIHGRDTVALVSMD